jgi:hypothetical protein
MAIGNQSSKIHEMHSTARVILLALQPIPTRRPNILPKRLDEQRQSHPLVLNEALWQVLQPLTFIRNPSAESRYHKVLCADGNFWRCKPVLAAWLADCPEYCHLYDLEWQVCFWCECPMNEYGY